MECFVDEGARPRLLGAAQPQFVGAAEIPWVAALILSCETYGWRSQLRTLGNPS